MFHKKTLLKILQNALGKNLCQSTLLNKVTEALLKKKFQRSCFPANSAKFLKTPFFIEYPHANASENDKFIVNIT